jgi:hypothetical protein
MTGPWIEVPMDDHHRHVHYGVAAALDEMEADGLITQGRTRPTDPPPFDALWGDPAMWADDHIVTHIRPPGPEAPTGAAVGIVYALPVAVLLWIVVGVLAWQAWGWVQ